MAENVNAEVNLSTPVVFADKYAIVEMSGRVLRIDRVSGQTWFLQFFNSTTGATAEWREVLGPKG